MSGLDGRVAMVFVCFMRREWVVMILIKQGRDLVSYSSYGRKYSRDQCERVKWELGWSEVKFLYDIGGGAFDWEVVLKGRR